MYSACPTGNKKEALIKFITPHDLKNDLLILSNERNITHLSLLSRISSE